MKTRLPSQLPRLSFSIRLRTILLIFLCLAVFMTWYVKTTQREYIARQAISQSSGVSTAMIVDHPLVPKWLSKLTGEETSISVWNVYFSSPEEFGDDDMKYIGRFKRLTRLNLTGTNVGDEGLKHVRELEHLQELRLDRTRITDKGLEHLVSLQKLQSLYMLYTGVTDKGVERLQQSLPKCKIRYCETIQDGR